MAMVTHVAMRLSNDAKQAGETKSATCLAEQSQAAALKCRKDNSRN
jgi:hypothetical protein